MNAKHVALIALALLACSPALAYIDRDTYFTGTVIPNTSANVNPFDYLYVQGVNASWNPMKLACTDTVNSSGYSTISQPDGYITSQAGSNYIEPSLNSYVGCSGKARLTVWGEFAGSNFLLAQFFYMNTTTPNGTVTNTTVRTYVRAVDGTSGAWVSGANVAIKNDQSGVWTNATNTIDGSHYINILTNQTLSGFVSGTGYSGGSSVNLPAWDGVYEIPMYATGTLLTPGTGQVSVVVEVKDQQTKEKLVGAHVDYTKSTGETEGYSTGSAGTANFLAPNSSTINIRVSKSGYTTVSRAVTTTAFGPDYRLIYLPKLEATPSVTATLPGDLNHDGVVDEKDVPGVTPITTLDTRSDIQKDRDMLNQLRDAGPILIWLCILVVMWGLCKMLLKW